MNFSDFLENAIGNWSLLDITPPRISGVWMSLLTDLSNDGQSIIEVSGTPYERIKVNFVTINNILRGKHWKHIII